MFKENMPLIVITSIFVIALWIVYNKVSSLEKVVVDICFQQQQQQQPKEVQQPGVRQFTSTLAPTDFEFPLETKIEDITSLEDSEPVVTQAPPKPALKKKAPVKAATSD